MDLYEYPFGFPPVNPGGSTTPYPYILPGMVDAFGGREKFLSGLDSDTRDYVLHHTEYGCPVAELQDCVDELHRSRLS